LPNYSAGLYDKDTVRSQDEYPEKYVEKERIKVRKEPVACSEVIDLTLLADKNKESYVTVNKKCDRSQGGYMVDFPKVRKIGEFNLFYL